MPLRLTIARAFYPPASPLGRWLGRRARDARQAESVYIVAVALVLTAASLVSQWSWILLGEAALGTPLTLWLLGAHGGGGLLLGWLTLWGWTPAIAVTARAERLEIAQGDTALVLSYDAIDRAERITADAYHRHWRRYAATRCFVNRLPDALLLLRTDAGPVALGLAPADLARLDAHLAERLDADPVERLVRAA